MKLRAGIRLVGGAAFALALTAISLVPASGNRTPAASAQPASGTFVGKIGATNSTIGVVMVGGGSIAVVYVTNGIDQAEWFRGATALPTGQVLSNTLEMRSRTGAAVIMETATGGGPRGRFRFPDGSIHDFTTAPALGLSGIYRGEARMGESTLVAGWIVSDQTSTVGAVLQRADFDTPDVIHPLLPGSLDVVGLRGSIPLVGAIEVRRLGDEG
jgi:hypothetical protein